MAGSLFSGVETGLAQVAGVEAGLAQVAGVVSRPGRGCRGRVAGVEAGLEAKAGKKLGRLW